MIVNVIYSFYDSPQRTGDLDITPTVLRSKEGFFTRLVYPLSNKYKKNLCKISCCIYDDHVEEILGVVDHWYNECNGKFYDDIIPGLLKDLFDIEINYVPNNQ